MPRGERAKDLDARAIQVLLSGRDPINEAAEVGALQVGSEPGWERPHAHGEDITDQPHRWTTYQRLRRESFEARVARYRADGLI
ncbi:hypothetical protein [Microbacterium sp. P5_E9]